MVDGHARNVVVGDSYHHVQSQPQTWQVFTAFFKGFERTANIIVFILMIGGAFWIMNETNAINKGIYLFLDRTQKMQKHKFFQVVGVNNLLIIAIMLMFSLFGSVFGMSEETIAFIVRRSQMPAYDNGTPGRMGKIQPTSPASKQRAPNMIRTTSMIVC